ncbi:DsbE family thiol:disulfide interchange protein [Microvirga mediterraneensis]|uniref:DsbE family thiol:disulfide interchange protein n=1 Tax=Microvirga mediterraneensis TaxID=2754695 RepID=A0A838BTY1_9HYPH|nr:DsbE family thiol:disulfide interchange protein [Microvirga mediterraneensis]MBA1158881.1 DsbE family thiol:disulfide interchange protein [Microvirga mediterraneensis]
MTDPRGLGNESPQALAASSGKPRGRLLLLLPILIFSVLALVFLLRLASGDPSKLPSALIGRPVPEFSLAPLSGLVVEGTPVPGLSTADLKGQVTVVNVWASWCVPCRQEHPVLMELAKESGLRVVGINYKDNSDNARRFLGMLGNPYAAVGVDQDGRTAINWGVYGVPETFVVDPDGVVRYRHVGPILPELTEEFRQKVKTIR